MFTYCRTRRRSGDEPRTLVKAVPKLRLVLPVLFVATFFLTEQVASLVSPHPVSASHCGGSAHGGQQLRIDGQFTTPAAYGVDGYLQYASGTLPNLSCDKLVMGLFVNTADRLSFIQVGIRYGYRDDTVVDSSRTVFVERVDKNCLPYSRVGFGSPSATNSPYYNYYLATSTNMFCVPFYTFGIKRDSWINAPFTTSLLEVASPRWTAQQEVGSKYSSPPWEWLGTTFHGHPTSPPGYGLAWYNQPLGTWNAWNSTISTTTVSASPFIYCDDVGSSFEAFHTVKAPAAC
jgi:hypothetical protein